MYSVSDSFLTAAKANARQILVKAVFNDSITLTGDEIIDMTVTEAVNSSDGVSMGAAISSKLVMKIKMPETPMLLAGAYVQPYVGYYGVEDYCPLGKFFVTKAESSNDFKSVFTLTGYDAFSKTEMQYAPTIPMPNTAEAILGDIASQCSFKLSDDIQYPSGSYDLYELSCRQYIGYFAGLTGKNAHFNRDGKLAFVWYTDNGQSVSRDIQYMGGFKRITDSDFVVHSITSGSGDNIIVSGSGVGITFDNPFITQETLDSIADSIGNISFTPAQLKWRGNPAIEAGDIIVAEDRDGISRTIYVMEQTLRISGGMYSEIKCYGDSAAAIRFDTSPQKKKLQQVYTRLQEAIKEATELLNGSNGGVFELLDENQDGINDGWIIHTADSKQFIKANVNGIGITTDGGATFENAMTAGNGINASAIHTGSLEASRISVGDASLGDVFSVGDDEDGHPVVTIGSSANDIKQKQTNDAVEFVDGSGSSVAKFSTTGAEWADMKEMKYCGFVWTKSAVTGNVRFAKGGN